MKVREVMTSEVISVTAGTTVREIAGLIRKHKIASVPVVDGKKRVIGIVGEADLIPQEMPLPFSSVRVPTLFKKVISKGHMELDELYQEGGDTPASDVMEDRVITVNADDDAGHAAWLMAHHDKKRLPVLENGKLVGIITRSDLVKILAGSQSSRSGGRKKSAKKRSGKSRA